MPIKAIVLGMKDEFIEELNGYYLNSQFVYKVGETRVWKLRFGGSEEKIEFDYSLLVPTSKGKVAYYRWDGSNLTQIGFNVPPESSTAVDYSKNFKLGEAIKAMMIKDPSKGLLDAAKWMVIIALFVLFIAVWAIWNTTVTKLTATVKPISEIANQTLSITAFMANEIHAAQQQQNETLNYMRNLTVYLERAQPISNSGT